MKNGSFLLWDRGRRWNLWRKESRWFEPAHFVRGELGFIGRQRADCDYYQNSVDFTVWPGHGEIHVLMENPRSNKRGSAWEDVRAQLRETAHIPALPDLYEYMTGINIWSGILLWIYLAWMNAWRISIMDRLNITGSDIDSTIGAYYSWNEAEAISLQRG